MIAQILGPANYAADFLSRMENDKTATRSLKLTDRIPVSDVEIDTEAKNTDIEMNNLFNEYETFGDEVTNETLQQPKNWDCTESTKRSTLTRK